ncbi:radical SAM family heme chaperone HemW [Campylobacter sp. 19-13652]|uniref:radical SAM family heme chaperone HemW n=1 Tax=Campylobacter sp. 19-13652 TaxID=2840180 RepID=UPI001C74D44F|nr:radical SAM family heme chaperone HemW [Campylobacter sp. 19-13652]BCX79666.1 coproporphyrinogen III oxidase [Campylobacter sp. 19-13652]
MLLYIHIPFCESKCPYCAFGSLVGQKDKFKAYFKALIKDFDSFSKDLAGVKFETVFIGGGTPSVVDAALYEELFLKISPFLEKEAEITSEANPNSASFEWISKMKEFGLNRLSMGAQSFYNDKLKMLGRTHDKSAVFKAVEAAKKAGLKRISVDLIYGTALDNKERIKGEVAAIKSLNISHASAYTLTLEEGTPFQNRLELSKDDEALARLVKDELENVGLKRYEVSNFGDICRHNLGYWQGKEYLGIGAYSVGFLGGARLYAPKSLNQYLASPNSRQKEVLSSDDMVLERLFLGLRSCVGVEIKSLPNAWQEKAQTLINEKKLEQRGDKIYAKEYLLADELALYITL